MTENKCFSVQPGLVISYFGNSVAVEAEDGQVFQCHLRRNQELPIVGDRVSWQLDQGETGTIVGIEPRCSMLARGDHRGKLKPIAANIDKIIVVMAPPPIFSEYLVDRYLLAAELLNISAVIVLNKTDLLNDAATKEIRQRLNAYTTISYPTLLTSVVNKTGLSELSEHLHGKTGVLVGPSGVGKSSIIAALGEHASIRIGDVSKKGSGKHTTTATRFYHLPRGGGVIDSPGVRDFNLWSVTRTDILQGFKEFTAFASECKFRDCAHLVEPGCAVQAGVADGKISAERYLSYQTLIKEAKP